MGRTGLARSLRDQLRRLPGGSLAWLLFTASTLPAAPPAYHQRSWQRADGLPDNSVRAVLQTRDGYLWVGTGAGLARFDGARFVVCNQVNVPALPKPRITALTEDTRGALWIGTESGLVRLYRGAFAPVDLPDDPPRPFITRLCSGRDGAVWIGAKTGVHRFQAGRFTGFPGTNEVTARHAGSMCEDADGDLWLSNIAGVYRWNPACTNFDVVFRHRPGKSPDLGLWADVKMVCAGGDLCFTGFGLLRRWRNGELLTWTNLFQPRGAFLTAFTADLAGKLWLALTPDGLLRFRDGHAALFDRQSGLWVDRPQCLASDREGNLWIGTEHGLVRWRDGRFSSSTTAHGLFDDLLNGILEDDGHLWLSCDRGIFRVRKADLDRVADGSARTVECVVLDEDDGMLDAETNGRKSQPPACRTRDGRLWFPTVQGVAVIDPARLPGRKVPPPPVVIEAVVARGGDRFEAPHLAPGTHLDLAPGSGRLLEFSYTANSFLAPSKVRFKYRLHGWDPEWTEAGPRRSAFYTNLRPGQYRFQVIACNNHGVWNETGASLPVHVEPYFYQTPYFQALAGCAALGLVWVGHRRRLRVLRRIHNLETQAALATERTRVAADLHDDLGGSLTHHLHLLEQARKHLPDAPAARQFFQDLSHSAGEAMNKVTEAIWATNPDCDTLEHLVTHLQEEAQSCLQSAGIATRFDIPAGGCRRPCCRGGSGRRRCWPPRKP